MLITEPKNFMAQAQTRGSSRAPSFRLRRKVPVRDQDNSFTRRSVLIGVDAFLYFVPEPAINTGTTAEHAQHEAEVFFSHVAHGDGYEAADYDSENENVPVMVEVNHPSPR